MELWVWLVRGRLPLVTALLQGYCLHQDPKASAGQQSWAQEDMCRSRRCSTPASVGGTSVRPPSAPAPRAAIRLSLPRLHPPPDPLGSQLQTELLCAPARQPEPTPAASPSIHAAHLHHHPWGAGQLCAAEPRVPGEVGCLPGLVWLHLVWRKRLGSG